MDYFFMSRGEEQASKHPCLIPKNEDSGERYARAVGQKGVGTKGELDWLITDISEELQSWGRAGGVAGKIILKSDGEISIKALRTAVARYHGGTVIPEAPAKGESQSNGAVEESGKNRQGVREDLQGPVGGEGEDGDKERRSNHAMDNAVGRNVGVKIPGRPRRQDRIRAPKRAKVQHPRVHTWRKSLVQKTPEEQEH